MAAACCAFFAGCGGEYILNVPDQVAPARGQVPVVVRLQRNDFFVLALGVGNEGIGFSMDGKVRRHAFTDPDGYAGVSLPAPARPGTYPVHVRCQDRNGREVDAEAQLHVWEPKRTIIAVDLDCLPTIGSSEFAPARTALQQLAVKANILYLTRRAVMKHSDAHEFLINSRYPDGPILVWRRKSWHYVSRGRFRMPRITVERRLVSQLPLLREQFSGLNVGICTGKSGARGFAEAGLRCIVVGRATPDVENLTRCSRWSDIAKLGL